MDGGKKWFRVTNVVMQRRGTQAHIPPTPIYPTHSLHRASHPTHSSSLLFALCDVNVNISLLIWFDINKVDDEIILLCWSKTKY